LKIGIISYLLMVKGVPGPVNPENQRDLMEKIQFAVGKVKAMGLERRSVPPHSEEQRAFRNDTATRGRESWNRLGCH